MKYLWVVIAFILHLLGSYPYSEGMPLLIIGSMLQTWAVIIFWEFFKSLDKRD